MGRRRRAGLSSCVDSDPRAMDDGVDDEWAAPAGAEAEMEAQQGEGDDDEYEDVEEEELEEEEDESEVDQPAPSALSVALANAAAGAVDAPSSSPGAALSAATLAVFASSAATQTPPGDALKGDLADGEWPAADGGELHMYYSNLMSLTSVHRREPNLTVLSLIGQPLRSLDGVECLKQLRELWVVECELTDVQAVERCESLEKLYLYSNHITEVPHLEALSRLQVLWLASNSISDVRPVGGGRALLDLNLSKNRISNLSGGLWLRCRSLRSLNLSGNPLFLLTDLLPLGEAPALKALQTADPMYGDSPVAQLCNYRSYVVHHVRNLESLEQLEVTEDERAAVDAFYAEKFLFYNMLRFHYQNLYMKEEKKHLMAFWRKMEAYKGRRVRYAMEKMWGAQENADDECAEAVSGSGCGTSDTLQTRMEHLKYKVKMFSKDLKDWRKSHAVSLQTRLQQVRLEQQHAGNLRFRDFSGDSEPMVICQRLLDSYICSHLRKKMGIEATQLLEVTHVTNKGLEVIADLRMGSKRRRSSSIMLLAPGGGLLSPSQWPFDITKRGFVDTGEYEVGVTNCLLYADRWWMDAAGHAKRLLSPALSDLAPTDSQYERRIAVVVIFSRDTLLVPCHRDHAETCAPRGPSPPPRERQAGGGAASLVEGLVPQPASAFLPPGSAHAARRDRSCCNFLVTSAHLVLAMIVLEFRYVFCDPLERFRQRMGWTADVHEQCSPPSGPRMQQLTEQNFQEAVTRVRKALGGGDINIGSLVHLTLVGCGIRVLCNLPSMPSVQTVNLSFNKLSSLKGLDAFCNARMMDLSYNEVTLNGSEGDSMRGRMMQLRSLDLSWNCVGRLLAALPLLGRVAPQLAAFDSRHNPVDDLRDSLHAAFFAKKTFPLLLNFDGEHIDDLLQAKRDSGCNAVWGDVLDLQVWKKPADLQWTVEARMAGGEGCMGEPGEGSSPPYWVCHKGLYLMDVKVTSAFASVHWADFSDNLLSDVRALLVALPNLEELSLRYNVIQTFPVLAQQWTGLKKLDLSRNYLKSIVTLQCGCFPSLELLDVSGNMLSDLNGIQSCENLVECYAACNRISYEANLLAAKSCRSLRMLDLTGNPVERRKDFRAFCVFHIRDLDYLNGQAVEESDMAEASDMFGGCLDRDFLLKTPCALELSTLQTLTLVNSALRKVNLPSGVLPQLERLDLSNNCLTYLWGLHTLPALKTLRLSYNQVSALRPPSGSLGGDGVGVHDAPSRCPTPASASASAAPTPPFPQLQMLLLDNNQVVCCKLLGLREMPCLSSLFLQHNEITSFDGLQGLTSLRFLVLDDNKLQMISSVECKSLTDLEEFWLENNKVSQLYFVRALQGLRRLFLAGNSISDLSQLKLLAHLKTLKELTLWGNSITRRPNFLVPLRELVPSLELLDGEPVESLVNCADSDSNGSR